MPEVDVDGTSWCHGSLPAEGPCRMQMADGDGQRVGSIHGLRRYGKFKQPGHHVLHLLLFGASVTDDRRLDGQRRIFGDFQPGGRGSQHGNSTDLTQLERRLHVESVENIFNRDFIGVVLDNDFSELCKDAGKAPRQRFARRELNRAARQTAKLAGFLHLDHPVAGVLAAAIDTHDSHVSAVYRGIGGEPKEQICG
jgi:hypothetical protein